MICTHHRGHLLMRVTRTIKRTKALILIELLTVIFIISSLVLLIIPNLRWSMYKTQFAGCQGNLKQLSTCVQMYSTENNDYYPDQLAKIKPQYIKDIPCCPSVHKDTYTSGYEVSDDYRVYTLYCKGSNHLNLNLKSDQPYFSLIEGLKP